MENNTEIKVKTWNEQNEPCRFFSIWVDCYATLKERANELRQNWRNIEMYLDGRKIASIYGK